MKFYVTTPIYYVNAEPTVGHAYSTIAADVLARYRRLRGEEVLFATGTDENGLKVARSAEEKGYQPKAYVDMMADRFREEWRALSIGYDDFIQTTEERHRRAVAAFFEALHESGDLYLGEYEGWYCVSDETYFRESELIDGRCPNPECGKKVERLREPAHFFRFSSYGDRLLEHIDGNPAFLLPEFRRNEVVRFIEGGLRDACVSRHASWGTPLPSSIPGSKGMVAYVWVDALINYLTVAGYPDDEEKFAHYWPADLHIMAKDIFVRFHATLWPAMLMAAGFPLPRSVFAHGFWTLGGEKISKSRGQHMPRPQPVLDTIVAETGCSRALAVDALRYHMLREVPFGLDGEFSGEALLGRYANDLANDLGNLVNRVLAMVGRYRQGRLPAPCAPDAGLAGAARAAASEWERCVDRLDFRTGLEAIWRFLAEANRFVDQQAPWSLAKQGDQAGLDRVLYSAAEAVRMAAVLTSPVMPNAADAIERQLGLNGWERRWSQVEEWGVLPGGLPIGEVAPLFPRAAAAPKKVPARKSPEAKEKRVITIKDFQKMDLRIGEILSAEAVPGADKLLKLVVDIGTEERTLVAGIALAYRPEQLVGKQVVVVTNLEPATIRGVRSEGMLLAGWLKGDDSSVSLVTPDRSLTNGSSVT